MSLFQYILIGEGAALFSILVHLLFRDKSSTRTPEKLSRSFFWFDNWKRLLVVPLIIWLSSYFIPVAELVYPKFKGAEFHSAYYVIVGLFSDNIIAIYKEYKKKKINI